MQEIRTHYANIDELVRECETDTENCGLYQNELVVNTAGQDWRAVGSYKKTVEFWYTDDPTKCDECEKEGLSTLEKVIVREAGSTYTSLREYLYKQGELIFIYKKDDGEYGLEEMRYYYSEGILIRYQLNTDVLDVSEVDQRLEQYLLKQSKNYQQVFLNSF